MTKSAETIQYYEIGSETGDDVALYINRAKRRIGANEVPSTIIGQQVNADEIPAGSSEMHRPIVNFERLLDIEARPGDNIYVFRISKFPDLPNGLAFDENSPILPIVLGDPQADAFLQDVTSYTFQSGSTADGDKCRWASFRCDADFVRNSDFAKRIEGLDPNSKSLRLPFCWNFRETDQDLPPWVFGEEEHFEEDHETHDHAADVTHGGVHPSGNSRSGDTVLVTHGGVHPSLVSYLSIPI